MTPNQSNQELARKDYQQLALVSSSSSSEQEQEQKRKYVFSSDWFSQHISHWKRILHGLENKKINVLEIGSFEGRSSTWILDELFKNHESRLVSIDSFERLLPEIDSEKNFLENIRKTGKENQVEVIKSNSWDALIQLNREKRIIFDFIYIDASHIACDVLSDTVLSWNLLKEEGIMIFDDYDSNLYKEEYYNARIAIDSFLSCYQQHIKIIEKYYQVAIKKVKSNSTFKMIVNV